MGVGALARWLVPCPFRGETQPHSALVSHARPTSPTRRHPTTLRRAIEPLISGSAVAAMALGAACGATDSPAATEHQQSTSATARPEGPTPPREVIIAVPSAPYVAEAVASPGSVTGTISASAEL